MNLIELLKLIPLFNALKDSDIEIIAESVRLQKLKQGQVLFRKGDEGTALYIIQKGAVKIVLPSRIGDEIIVTIFSEGDFFGEMALLDGEARSADAVSLEPSEVLILNRNNFLKVLQSSPTAIKSVLSMLSNRLRKTDDLLEDTCFLNISNRLTKKLIELAASHGKKENDTTCIDLSFTQKELGDMIGATRESINKELKILRDKDLINTEGSKIIIKNIEQLQKKMRLF